jgi:hypothetical protein
LPVPGEHFPFLRHDLYVNVKTGVKSAFFMIEQPEAAHKTVTARSTEGGWAAEGMPR